MVTNSETMEKIKKIISKNYSHLLLSIVGQKALTPEEIKQLRSQGIAVSATPSLLELAYYHNLLSHPEGAKPTSTEDMQSHQERPGVRPSRKEFDYAAKHANESMKLSLEKLKQDTTARLLSLIQENNQNFKFGSFRNANQTEEVQKLIKESTLTKLKQKLRDASGDSNRDWQRIAVTEVANAISSAAVDRVITQNENKHPDEIYVYKIPVNDAALCSKCREFYLDNDGSPKVYTLAYLLGNGSNYGKKRSDWLPTVTPAHPSDRESGIIELKSGWKVLPGGRQTFIGNKEWTSYIVNKVIK